MLRMEGKPVESVRLSFYRNDGTNRELQGFAVSTLDGTFRLFQNEATGPLWLSSGEYSVTLESEGAITREWPKEFSDPAKTPLQVNWEERSKMLELEIPRARIRY